MNVSQSKFGCNQHSLNGVKDLWHTSTVWSLGRVCVTIVRLAAIITDMSEY